MDKDSINLIIQDIYEQLTELGEVEYGELEEELIDRAANPININNAKAEDLEQLHFLSDIQIDAILSYINKHPMQAIYELQLIRELPDYTIRDLLPFIYVSSVSKDEKMYASEVFHYAKHEINARLDARNIESNKSDPFFAQGRYKFNYKNRVQFGASLRRPVGGEAKDLQYGGYVQLNDFGPVHTIVAGNYQASFGQGLVFATPFHTGKSSYVLTTGNENDGLRKYSSIDGTGLHGVGTTFRISLSKMRIDISALYSLHLTADTFRHHTLGANINIRYRNFKIGITAAENLYSDSVQYYRNLEYNEHYFRGTRQFIIGANFRYNYGIFDLFGEFATAQNQQWGYALELGSRVNATQGVGLILLYRYYSPWFDNTLGYAFSETSRVSDENGLYLGTEITRLKHWRFSVYGDIFRFEGYKYGISYCPSWGYDAMSETSYTPNDAWNMTLRIRAKEKALRGTYGAMYQFNWQDNNWSLRSQIEGNIVHESGTYNTWGISVFQDVRYRIPTIPLSFALRLQGFDVRNWNNRIYIYEHDVLYSFAIPATYGVGGRAYLNMQWTIIPQLSLFLRVSETVYNPKWTSEKALDSQTKTEVHFMLRVLL